MGFRLLNATMTGALGPSEHGARLRPSILEDDEGEDSLVTVSTIPCATRQIIETGTDM